MIFVIDEQYLIMLAWVRAEINIFLRSGTVTIQTTDNSLAMIKYHLPQQAYSKQVRRQQGGYYFMLWTLLHYCRRRWILMWMLLDHERRLRTSIFTAGMHYDTWILFSKLGPENKESPFSTAKTWYDFCWRQSGGRQTFYLSRIHTLIQFP